MDSSRVPAVLLGHDPTRGGSSEPSVSPGPRVPRSAPKGSLKRFNTGSLLRSGDGDDGVVWSTGEHEEERSLRDCSKGLLVSVKSLLA